MATAYIKNKKQLADAILEKYVASALKKTQQEIYDCIQESINEYYSEYPNPYLYDRTYKFLNSLVKTDIVRVGNSISCEVKIDENYLNYSYPGQDAFYNNLPATGLNVVQWANREDDMYGNHGGTVDAGREQGFLDEAMQTLGGETGILAILKSNLKKRGLHVV